MKTDAPSVPSPILIPKVEFALITELVAKIGESKDGAELQIYFREALEKLAVPRARIEAVLKKLDVELKTAQIDHQALSRSLQIQLSDTKLLKNFVEDLEGMN